MYYLAIESSCDETSLAILKIGDTLDFHKANFYDKINQIEVVSSIISSQIETHAKYGGVVPEVGARMHAEQIHGLFQIVLNEALTKLSIEKKEFYNKLETIFVTSEPGLMSALRVGIEFAKSLQFYIDKDFNQQVKLESVNHLQGHIATCFYEMENNTSRYCHLELSERSRAIVEKLEKLDINSKSELGKLPLDKGLARSDWGFQGDAATNDFKTDAAHNGDTVVAATTYHLDSNIFPHLHLMISGGNTQIRLLSSWAEWKIVGQTIDDAAGECFDKAARMVGIPYPGGATLSRIAGDQYSNTLSLPIAMLQSKDLNISLSGLKTAVRYKVQGANIPNLNLDEPLTTLEIDLLKNQNEFVDNLKLQFIKQICISTQYAIIEQITRKIDLAIKQHQPKSIGISGGVSANRVLINKIQELKSIQSLEIQKIYVPDSSLTGDNAIMIGLAGLMKL
jgi:glycoprotease/Kae1 family metallohydrolase